MNTHKHEEKYEKKLKKIIKLEMPIHKQKINESMEMKPKRPI